MKLHSLHLTSARPLKISLTGDKGNNEQLNKINYKMYIKTYSIQHINAIIKNTFCLTHYAIAQRC